MLMINKLIVAEMISRGFILNTIDCNKLNLQIYYQKNTVRVFIENDIPMIRLDIMQYCSNRKKMINYYYEAKIYAKGFGCDQNLKHPFIVKILDDIVYNSGAINYTRDFFNES